MRGRKLNLLHINLPSNGDQVVFRIPSKQELREFETTHKSLDWVTGSSDFFDYVMEQLIYEYNMRRVKSFSTLFLEDSDLAHIRSKIKAKLAELADGVCVVCGAETKSTETIVCNVCFSRNWAAGSSVGDFSAELRVSKLVGTSAWAIRDSEVSYLDPVTNSPTIIDLNK